MSVRKEEEFAWEVAQNSKLPFLDCVLHVKEDGDLDTEVYRIPSQTNKVFFFFTPTTQWNINWGL